MFNLLEAIKPNQFDLNLSGTPVSLTDFKHLIYYFLLQMQNYQADAIMVSFYSLLSLINSIHYFAYTILKCIVLWLLCQMMLFNLQDFPLNYFTLDYCIFVELVNHGALMDCHVQRYLRIVSLLIIFRNSSELCLI